MGKRTLLRYDTCPNTNALWLRSRLASVCAVEPTQLQKGMRDEQSIFDVKDYIMIENCSVHEGMKQKGKFQFLPPCSDAVFPSD